MNYCDELDKLNVGDFVIVDSHAYEGYVKIVDIIYETEEQIEQEKQFHLKENKDDPALCNDIIKRYNNYKPLVDFIKTLTPEGELILLDDEINSLYSSESIVTPAWEPKDDELVWLVPDIGYPVLRPYNTELLDDLKVLDSYGREYELQPFNGYPPIKE